MFNKGKRAWTYWLGLGVTWKFVHSTQSSRKKHHMNNWTRPATRRQGPKGTAQSGLSIANKAEMLENLYILWHFWWLFTVACDAFTVAIEFMDWIWKFCVLIFWISMHHSSVLRHGPAVCQIIMYFNYICTLTSYYQLNAEPALMLLQDSYQAELIVVQTARNGKAKPTTTSHSGGTKSIWPNNNCPY